MATPNKRQYLSNSNKLAILRDTVERQANGESLRKIAASHGVDPVQIRRWKKQKDALEYNNKQRKTLPGRGRKSCVKHLEQEIVGWTLELRALGLEMRFKHLMVKAAAVDDDFRARPRSQQYQIIRRLAKSNCLTNRRVTHRSQRDSISDREDALRWLRDIRVPVNAPNQDRAYVMNMDQTPFYFSLGSGVTLDMVGASTVLGKESEGRKRRATISLCITASGEKLRPMVIFKGKEGGDIESRELATSPYRRDLFLACQPNAYQDENNMLRWIDEVIVPHLQQKAAGAPVLLFLDAFTAHHTQAVLNKLDSMGVRVIKIPEGCTWLVQPVDVGIGKTFRDHCRDKWWDWMISQAQAGRHRWNVDRELASQWISETWRDFPADIVRNAWRRNGLSFFLDDETDEGTVTV